jgi:capsular exopolysaccharide synthesis family protein
MSVTSPWPSHPANAPQVHPEAPRAPEGLGELDLMQIFFGQKLLVIFCILAGCGVGYYFLTQAPVSYESNTRLRVYRTRPVQAIDGKNVVNTAPNLDTHAVLMTSPAHLARAVREFQLQDLLDAGGDPERYIAFGLTVKPGTAQSEFIDLTFKGPNPHDCPKVLNAIVVSYMKYLQESQRGDTQKALELIDQAREKLLEDLNEKTKRYNEFKSGSALVFVGNETRNIHQERLTQIEEARSQLLIKETQLRAELDSIQTAQRSGASRETILLMIDKVNRQGTDAGPTADAPTLQGTLLPLLFEEQRLVANLGGGHPKVKEIRQKIELTRAMFQANHPAGDGPMSRVEQDWLTIYVDSLRQGLHQLEEHRTELNQSFLAEQEAARLLASEENQDRLFKEDLDRTNRLFDAVLDQLQELDLAKESDSLRAEVINPPEVGWEVGASYPRYLGTGAAVGWLVAIGISLIIETSNRGFRGLEDVTRQLHLPVMGTVPYMEQRLSKRELRHPKVDSMVVCCHKPGSFAAEAYRAVRSAVVLGAHKMEIRVLQITSSESGAGKSTMSANLAVTVASSGKRCLLIDADTRRPTQHTLFGHENKVGLTTVLRDAAEYPDAILPTDIEQLDLLTAGPRVGNPAELLMSDRFRQLLETLRQQYDFIVIDTPPALVVSDACIVSPHVDGVLFVTRLGRNARVSCTRGLERLRMVGAKVFGIALNAVPLEKSEYGLGRYHYGYNGRYGYHYTSEESYSEPPRSERSQPTASGT